MGRGRLEVLVDNAWRTHVGRRGGEECYDTYRSVLYRDPRASPWPLRVTGVSYARARQWPGIIYISGPTIAASGPRSARFATKQSAKVSINLD